MDSSFKGFITQNGIIATAAGITIGFATATFFKSLVADMILPVFFMILVKGTGKVSTGTGNFFAQFLSNKGFRFTNFVSELITWILIILAAWLIINLINKYIMKNVRMQHTRAGTFQETNAEAFMQQQQQQMQNAYDDTEMYNNATAMSKRPTNITEEDLYKGTEMYSNGGILNSATAMFKRPAKDTEMYSNGGILNSATAMFKTPAKVTEEDLYKGSEMYNNAIGAHAMGALNSAKSMFGSKEPEGFLEASSSKTRGEHAPF